MKRIFVSYAREDKTKVDELTRRLLQLGYDVWVDTELRGGQSWWEEILAQIGGCDVFLAVVSPTSLNSNACHLERSYAQALGKPMLPVAVEVATQAMPRELSVRQVVDYTAPGEDAAFALLGALAGMPDAPALPSLAPVPPSAPLSYLIDLIDTLNEPELTKAQQRQVLDELEPGLRSSDREERSGAKEILHRMAGREDLYADVASRIEALDPSLAVADSVDAGAVAVDVAPRQPSSTVPRTPEATVPSSSPALGTEVIPKKKLPVAVIVAIVLGTVVVGFVGVLILGLMAGGTQPTPVVGNQPGDPCTAINADGTVALDAFGNPLTGVFDFDSSGTQLLCFTP